MAEGHHIRCTKGLQSVNKLEKHWEGRLVSETRSQTHYLFHLQPMAPDPFQKVTEAGNQGVLFHTSDVHLSVPQLHSLSAHLLHQHPLGLGMGKQDRALQ